MEWRRTNTMKKQFRLWRKVVVDYIVQERNIHTTSRNIRDQKHTDTTGAELFDSLSSGHHIQTRMYGRALYPGLCEKLDCFEDDGTWY